MLLDEAAQSNLLHHLQRRQRPELKGQPVQRHCQQQHTQFAPCAQSCINGSNNERSIERSIEREVEQIARHVLLLFSQVIVYIPSIHDDADDEKPCKDMRKFRNIILLTC